MTDHKCAFTYGVEKGVGRCVICGAAPGQTEAERTGINTAVKLCPKCGLIMLRDEECADCSPLALH